MINLKGWQKEHTCYATDDLELVKQAMLSVNTYDFVQVQGTFVSKKPFKFALYKVKVNNDLIQLPQEKITISLRAKKVTANISKSLAQFVFDYGSSVTTTLIFRR